MENQQPKLPEEIKLPSAVIPLEKGKDYLFIFSPESGVNIKEAGELTDLLNNHGFHGFAIMVKDIKGVKVFEQELK